MLRVVLAIPYVVVFVLFVLCDWIGSAADWLEDRKERLERAMRNGQEKRKD